MTSRTLTAAQLGPIQLAEGRDIAVARMVRLTAASCSATASS